MPDADALASVVDIAKRIWSYGAPFLTAYLGYKYGLWHVKEKNRLEFKNRQLNEFYSPMVGCLKAIKAKSQLRVEVHNASDTAWRKICENRAKPFEDPEEQFEPFDKTIEYDNRQFREEILPLYDEMVAVFKQNMGLATESTRKWHDDFVKFVELWHRSLDGGIAPEARRQMGYLENDLQPFYQDLERQVELLQKEISRK